MNIIETLSNETGIDAPRLERTIALFDEGNTVPFVARYRKEVTGGLDDTVLRELTERLAYLRNLEKRKEEVSALIEQSGNLTEEITAALTAAVTLTEVDDIYRPFRPKRKTRASVAKERGLAPLAELIMEQRKEYAPTLKETAEQFVSEEKGVNDTAEALSGAMDIIAEEISDNAEYRKEIRLMTMEHGKLVTSGDEKTESVYELYYDYSEALETVPSHRVLAINRGEREGILKVTVECPADLMMNYITCETVNEPKSPAVPYILRAVCDSYDRLIAPSIEREIRNELTDRAGEQAIGLFSENLKNLLMGAPLKGKTVMGYDPGYRTGCKLAVVDKTGRVLDTAVIYPTKPHERIAQSRRTVEDLINKYSVDVIAIGNGTASGESERFISELLNDIDRDVRYIMVSEAGASVYSASKLGAEEFPDFDVTERSAVSIARRLQDPMAELVKIDPKSIGVGQYQHDMKEARLDEALGGVVEDCVNSVGVDVNTASYSLLSYISGINITAAKNIVKYREENGEFASRAQILKVPRIGAKAYEQCAGFLRVSGSDEILDNTGVHPESYGAARSLLKRYGCTEDDVRAGRLGDLGRKVKKDGVGKVAEAIGVGEPTLKDIISELEKPGRDVRDSLPQPELRSRAIDISELKEGMTLTGVVRNVIDFGAFVDIGVHQDGLVHISEMSDKFVKHPSDVLSVGDRVTVWIKSLDIKKKRIGLSMKTKKG
jgi:uncharacterized protein